MSTEDLDDVFGLMKNRDQTISLQAFDLFCVFPTTLINEFLHKNEFENAKALVNIISSIRMVNEGLLNTIIILASDENCANFVAENDNVMQRLFSLAKNGDPIKFVLPLTQVSRMVPQTTHKTLFKLRQNYFSLLTGLFGWSSSLFWVFLETFNECDGGIKQAERLNNVAYVFLNVSQISTACDELFGNVDDISTLSSFISNKKAITSFKCIVAKILLNISYHKGFEKARRIIIFRI